MNVLFVPMVTILMMMVVVQLVVLIVLLVGVMIFVLAVNQDGPSEKDKLKEDVDSANHLVLLVKVTLNSVLPVLVDSPKKDGNVKMIRLLNSPSSSLLLLKPS
eukprot:TRINITY_DN6960_c0_g1_i2.p2 TRINITY_DN6960_c0_g1~~TRINITY_DN6960_c0_g1_i2.p2  ORF type:complete len:103 (+),score=10.84 TRINITY_DN6960_c0_g1_i2:680-988(+)